MYFSLKKEMTESLCTNYWLFIVFLHSVSVQQIPNMDPICKLGGNTSVN